MKDGRLVLALVAHDNKKSQMAIWASAHKDRLSLFHLVGTGHTAKLVQQATSLQVEGYLSGPMGGDQQIGAAIAEGLVDGVFFFWDPLSSQPHDPDVKALMRIAAVYDIPFATNEATATAVLSYLATHKLERKE